MKLQGDTCPICLEVFPTSTSTVQPCNHSFCCACISTWASLRATCPLCLEPFQTICVSTEEEDTKEEIIKINDPSNAYLKREEEDFECLDHKHFLKEFQALYKRAKETEFELKTRVMVKKGAGATERDYQIIMHMKQEIELKLAFLAQERKIFPKELLGEIEHFSGMIKSFSYGGEKTREIEIGYVHDIYVEEEYYEGQETQNDGYCLFDFAVKKSGKGKKRNNRRGKAKENFSAWDE